MTKDSFHKQLIIESCEDIFATMLCLMIQSGWNFACNVAWDLSKFQNRGSGSFIIEYLWNLTGGLSTSAAERLSDSKGCDHPDHRSRGFETSHYLTIIDVLSHIVTSPGFGVPDAARIYLELMRRLGHNQFYVQGGDFGSLICIAMSQLYPEYVCKVKIHNCLFIYQVANVIYFTFALGCHRHALIFLSRKPLIHRCCTMQSYSIPYARFTGYEKLRVVHAPGMAGTFPPSP